MKRAHVPGPSGCVKRARPALAVAPAAPVPSNIQLDDAIESRRAEIIALHRAMKNAREAGNTRAWQLLPRHLRRRAASHNLLRLPAYLRGKARAELRASNTAAKTRGELRRRMPERTIRGFVRRRAQLAHRAERRTKRWLETHLWHAKRFRMTGDKRRSDGGGGRWGFSLAETPHLKSHRASWRAANKGTTLHDASYTSVFRVCAAGGNAEAATRRLQLFLHLAGALHGWEDHWTTGAQLCRTVLLARPGGTHPPALLSVQAPIAVLWLPGHEVCVFVHPAGARDVEMALTYAVAAIRRKPTHDPPIRREGTGGVKLSVRRVAMAPPTSIAVGLTGAAQRQSRTHTEVPGIPHAHLDGFNIFELVGPDAPRVLGGVLRAPSGSNAPLFKHIVCQSGHIASADLPEGLVVPVEVDDPRMSFPPKNESASGAAPEHTDVLPSRAFFDYDQLPRFTQSEINRRTAHSTDRVPIVLIQKTVGTLCGYTLLVPRGWGQAFWLSLVHTGAKVLGQRQVRQQCLNANIAAFPHDWVGTHAHSEYDNAMAAERAAQWSRRPPAKRVNHAALGRVHPFGGADMWRHIAGAQLKLAHPTRALERMQGASNIDHPENMPPLPWARVLYTDGVLNTPLPEAPLSTLVPVILHASRKGAFGECATLHLPAVADVPRWRSALDPPTREKDAAARHLLELENSAAGPPIGAVTTGDYALASGSGRASAVVRLDAWLALCERERERESEYSGARQWGRLKRNRVPLQHLVLVRNVDTPVVRAASAQLARL